MARNRRKADGELTFSWVATKLLLFCLLVGLFLGVTFLQRRNLRMGDELRVLDRELSQAKQKTVNLEALLARCKSPRELENSMVRLRINMARPSEDQIRRFREPVDSDDEVIKPRLLVQTDPVPPTTRSRERW